MVDSLPEFLKQTFINWSNCFASNFKVPPCIQSNFLWYNKHILIGNKPVYLSSFSDKKVNFINNLLDCLEYFKSWNVLIIKPAYLSSSSDKIVNFMNNLLDYLRNFKSCNVLKK